MRLIFLLCTYFIFLSSCKNQQVLISPQSDDEPVKYSAVYLIHADANYLYHDADGNALRADEKVKTEAKYIGEQAKNGEIFIFHLKPERKILGLFPKKDRHLLHYRNGKLVNEGYYSPKNKNDELFTAEADIFTTNRAKTVTDSSANILLYFGHEIPSKSGWVYHHSQKDVDVHAGTFSGGIKNLLNEDDELFDLTVLSTCNNGNPVMVRELQPITKNLLASPQNLHLSHIDTDEILKLENEYLSGDSLAKLMAEKTFHRLSSTIHTETSLSVYELDEVEAYLPTLDSLYNFHLQEIDPLPFEDNIDCADLSLFNDIEALTGVTNWFNPAKFGRRAQKENHSGWGCRPAKK